MISRLVILLGCATLGALAQKDASTKEQALRIAVADLEKIAKELPEACCSRSRTDRAAQALPRHTPDDGNKIQRALGIVPEKQSDDDSRSTAERRR